MARMPSKRWDTQIEKEYQKWMKGSRVDGWLFISRALLSRQHAAFVRMVKKLHDQVDQSTPHSNSEADEQIGYMRACLNILAALQKGGKK